MQVPVRRVAGCLVLLSAGAFLLPAQEPERPKDLVATYPGHTETVYAVAISPDGKRLLTASFDKTLKLFDLAGGKELRTFGGEKGHQNLVLAAAFAPDGQTFASGGSDNSARIWDVPLAAPLRALAAADAVTATAISSDGKSAAAGSKDGSIKVLNPADGKEIYTLKGHVGAVSGLAYSPTNVQLLVSSGLDGTLRFWNLADGKPTAVVVAHARPVTALAFATGGTQVYTAAEDGVVKFWQVPSPPPRPLAGHTDTVRALALAADGNAVVTGSTDRNVRLFNADGGAATRTLSAAQPITAVAALGSGSNMVTLAGTSTGQVLAWGGDGKPLLSASAHTAAVTGLAVSPGGAQFASVGADGNLAIWSAPLVAARTIAQPADVKFAALSADGKRVLTVNADNQVRFWNAASGQAERAAPVNATAIALTSDGAAFVAAAADNTLLYQKRDGSAAAKLPNQAGVVALATHPGGSQVAAAHADGAVRLWPLPFADKMPKPLWEARLPGVRRLMFESSGNRILALTGDKALHALDARTGKEMPAFAAHEAALTEVCFSGDGTRLATADGKSAVIRTVADGKELSRLTLPAGATRLALSAKGDRLAVALPQDGKLAIGVFDAAGGQRLLMSDDRFTSVAGLFFDPASRALVIAADKVVAIIDVPVLSVRPVHAGGATGVAYLPSNSLVTSGKDKAVRQWDPNTAKEIRTFGPLAEAVEAIALSRDGAQLAAAAGKQVKLFNVADGKELQSIAHPANVIALGFNADRSRLATGATDNLARVWDLARNAEVQAFGHGAAVHAVMFSPAKPSNLITASADRSAVVNTISLTRIIDPAPKPIHALALHPSGSLLVGADNGSVRLVNTGSGALERTFAGEGAAVLAVAASRNGNVIATAGADRIVRLYNNADAAPIGHFATPAVVRSLAFHPNNTSLFTSGDDRSATMWNVSFQPGNPPPPEFGKPIQHFEHPGVVPTFALSADGAILVTGADDKQARVWKVAGDGPTRNLQHPNLVDAVAYNKDGTQLATACHDGIVRIWDLAKGAVLKQISAHTQPQPSAVYCVAWSPDGKQIASASLDKSIKIWDATSGNLVKEIKGYDEKANPKGHRDGVFSVAWSPDGKQIVSGSSDRTIKMWNVADGAHVRDFVNPALPTTPLQPAAAHPGWVYHLRYTPGGQIVSVGIAPRGRGYIALWNPTDGKLLRGAELPLGHFYDVAVTPDGTQFAVACGPRMRGAPEAEAVLLKK